MNINTYIMKSSKTKSAKRPAKVSRTSEISYKSAATVRKRRNYIESLTPANQAIANEFLAGKTLEQVNKKFATKKSMVIKLVNEIDRKGIYFRQLKNRSTSKSK